MSQIISVSKSYSCDSSSLKTPNFKEIVAVTKQRIKDAVPHAPILMDEYGQTPDHYYLARKSPPSFLQVKRRLDLQLIGTSYRDNLKTYRIKQKRKSVCSEKQRGKYNIEKPRYDTSLGQLTKKFLKLLSDAVDGVINLNTACSLLSVPKRRLYDITNVLEGAGLLQKTSRNNIQWMGRKSLACAGVVKSDLEKEIDMLDAKENKLDELIYFMKLEVDAVKKSTEKYQYLTSDDLRSVEDFSQDILIGIKTSPAVQMLESSDKTLLIKSKNTEMEVYLLFEDISFSNLLHSKTQLGDNTYSIKIEKHILKDRNEETKEEPDTSEPCNEELSVGTMWNEGDTVIKNAFITEEEDIAPMGRNFLLQTEDQDFDPLSFSILEPIVEHYAFSLDDGEGLTDLFDCSFSSL